VSVPVAVQALVTGLATGAAYGLIALGFTLVQRLTRVLALAHGDIVIGAVFVAVLAVIGATPVAAGLGPAQTIAVVVVALAAGALLSAAVYALALRPFLPRATAVPGFLIRPAGDVLGWVAGGLAAGLLVRELLGLPFAQQAYALPDPLGSPGTIGLGGGITVPVRALEVLALGLAVGVGIERALALTGAGAV
jgi:branched-subunit amino acid ABC-type transport system permease component